MPAPRRPVRALAWFRFRGREVPILPLRAALGFLASLLALVAAALFLDRALIPAARRTGGLASRDWQAEEYRILRNNVRKNLATRESPVWSSAGFPVPTSPRKPRRILVSGDSFVWGSGHTNVNELWWRQLELELEHRGYGEVEVIASGLGGWSTRRQLEAVRRIAPLYLPDLVIWGFVTNDADEGLVAEARPDPEAGPGGPLANLRGELRRVRLRKTGESGGERPAWMEYQEWELRLLAGANLDAYARTVCEVGELHRNLGIPGFVLTLPTAPLPSYFRPRHDPVRPLFEDAGLPFVDVLDPFVAAFPDAEHDPAGLLPWGVNPANGHPGLRSNHFYAARAADFLEQRFPGVLGRRGGPSAPAAPRVNDWMPYYLDPAPAGPAAWTFRFPDDPDYVLRMPSGRSSVQLSFERPADLSAVRLRGADLEAASLLLSPFEPVERVPGGWIALPEVPGPDAAWSLPPEAAARPVLTIRVEPRFRGPDRTLRLDVLPAP